jgi:hypothetical protein
MNDEQLITALRAPLADVHLATPLSAIEQRGRRHRRRGIAAATTATTAVAGAAVLAALAMPDRAAHEIVGSHLPAPRTSVSATATRTPIALAAWTVAARRDGTVQVTIRQLHDPAGLQAQLRADGIPANVSFDSSSTEPRLLPPPECQTFNDHGWFVVAPAGTADDTVAFTIDPTSIPSGAGVALQAGYDPQDRLIGHQGFVQATPGCTGS